MQNQLLFNVSYCILTRIEYKFSKMAWTHYQKILAILMVVTGSFNTLSVKWVILSLYIYRNWRHISSNIFWDFALILTFLWYIGTVSKPNLKLLLKIILFCFEWIYNGKSHISFALQLRFILSIFFVYYACEIEYVF